MATTFWIAARCPKDPPPLLSFAFTLVRLAEGLDQKDVADKAGIPPSLVSEYEKGTKKKLHPERCDWLLDMIGVERERIEVGLFCAALLLKAEVKPGAPVDPPSAVLRHIDVLAAKAGKTAHEETRQRCLDAAREAQAQEERRQARKLWARLKLRTQSARLALVEEAPTYQTWALAERLCTESERAAADDPREALDLAELALEVAERVGGEQAWRDLLAGYVWAHIGNARRVRSDLPGAEDAFCWAWKLWEAGAAADTGLLDGSRLLDLEASLLRAQRKMAAALERLDQALEMNPTGEGRGRLLVKKGATLVEMGAYEVAVEVLREAALWVDREREPRWYFGLHFNFLAALCHLRRHEEAAAGLPELRALRGKTEERLDPLRLRWLEGRVAGGLGRTAEGIEALSAVRAGFAAEKIHYSEALVSLELAGLYIEQGRTGEVKALVRQMESAFRDQGVHQEARKALELFRRAVELEAVTVELVCRLVAYLYRAQHDPELQFEME